MLIEVARLKTQSHLATKTLIVGGYMMSTAMILSINFALPLPLYFLPPLDLVSIQKVCLTGQRICLSINFVKIFKNAYLY